MTAQTTRRRLFLAFAAGLAGVSVAGARPAPAPAAAPAAWRAPVLVVAGAAQPVRLQALRIDVELAGGVAETRVQMEFFNPNSRVLEGNLQFPLADGQVVSGFSLDIDGALRDAVPVEKARAEQVFEDIARRRVDPGLLQATLGNNYALRIYPLEPGRTRTVVLKLVERAPAQLLVPLAYAGSVARFELSVRHAGTAAAPTLAGPAWPGLAFARDPAGGFVARLALADAALPREPLRVVMPARNDGEPEVTTEARGGDTFFTVSLPVAGGPAPRPLPGSVQIVWDASGSGANRAIDRELALLDDYFRRAGRTEVTLARVADVAFPPERFTVRGGDWSALRSALLSTVYDGASHLGAVRHDGVSAEAIWFSDGLANYGTAWRLAFPVPVFAVSSAASSDPAALRALAEASGGRLIDLQRLDRAQAATALLARGPQLVEAKAVGARDLVVESRHPSAGRLVMAGAMTSSRAALTLRLRDSDGSETTRVVRIDAARNPSRLAATQWARLALGSLEGDARANRSRILDIGRRFGLATRETSLLVLERADDYVRHGIEPPPALREAVARVAATTTQSRERSDAERLADVVRRFEARVSWWNRDFPKDGPKPPLAIAKSAARGALGIAGDARRERTDAGGPAMESLAQRALPAAAPAPRRGAAAEETKKNGGTGSSATSISIALQPARSDAPWLKRLEGAPPAARQAVYLDERGGQAMNVGFFLDAADFFLAHGDRPFGLRALSNLAEMDLQNRQVLRLLAYRLQQAGEVGLAVPVFERVLELAPHEPQSHRDLGLALADAGAPQRAVESLYAVVTGRWDGRFPDVDLIALAELNAVRARAVRDGRAVDVSAFEPRLMRELPLDLRIVLAWDADATDVDLHVVDPDGEEVYYGHALSTQGGAISRDATGGYGPEEFSLKIAKPGVYRVEAQFFGHRQQVLSTSTGLMLWLSSGFATAAQQDRRTTLRLKSQGGERVVVGQFEVGPRP